MRLRQWGLSKARRRLVATLMKRHGLPYLHIDALGDVLSGFATFDRRYHRSSPDLILHYPH
ncbi:DUF5983 family protein [Yersinia vastinensis]|uniref:DUF5983 family protein n=1 Tax=Yersinia vastinensis TaxID=2890318 RepID=UPI0011876E91|nr:DUF5983 family protein [Yersinia vastinensis]